MFPDLLLEVSEELSSLHELQDQVDAFDILKSKEEPDDKPMIHALEDADFVQCTLLEVLLDNIRLPKTLHCIHSPGICMLNHVHTAKCPSAQAGDLIQQAEIESILVLVTFVSG